MSSPVDLPFLSFIQLDRNASSPIYIQAAQQIINAIQRGHLLIGSKLPGTRSLSDILQVHRKTVTAVYAELEAQGWVEVRPNKGTFVINPGNGGLAVKTSDMPVSLARYPEKTGYFFSKSNILDSPFEYSHCSYGFNDGVPDIRLMQMHNLSRIYSATMKRKSNRKKLGMYNQEGSEYFKAQLSTYLNLSRGLHITQENVLITRSTEMSLYIISQLLITIGDLVLVGELSFFAANMVFQKSGARIQTIPIDEQGIQVDYIRDNFEPGAIRLIYITPHHHYPTTVTLSAQRRIALLQLASEYGFVIIEDDHDYDFQYEQSAVMPLASADTQGMVIYIGAFGKSLAPGFRTGFVVAPYNLMCEMRKYLGIIDRQGDIIMEQALGEMIEEGDINRHLKKSLKVYRERRDLFCELLVNFLPEVVSFKEPTGGLALWTEWNVPFSLLKFANSCIQDDLFIPKTLLYQNAKVTAMRLGFGHLNDSEMEQSVAILKSRHDKMRY